MKKLTLLYLIAITLPLILFVVYVIPAQAESQTATKPAACSTVLTCASPSIPAEVSSNMMKVKFPTAATNNTANTSWLFISPEAKKEFDKAVAKKKETVFSIFITGYG